MNESFTCDFKDVPHEQKTAVSKKKKKKTNSSLS